MTDNKKKEIPYNKILITDCKQCMHFCCHHVNLNKRPCSVCHAKSDKEFYEVPANQFRLIWIAAEALIAVNDINTIAEAEEFVRLREEKLIIDSGFREIEEAKHAGNNLDVAINKASEVLAEANELTQLYILVEEFKKSQVKK